MNPDGASIKWTKDLDIVRARLTCIGLFLIVIMDKSIGAGIDVKSAPQAYATGPFIRVYWGTRDKKTELRCKRLGQLRKCLEYAVTVPSFKSVDMSPQLSYIERRSPERRQS